jgi:hypothetical protein
MNPPFNIPWGSSIWARVEAINVIGQSGFSAAGNGAVILSVPGAPTDLQNVAAKTTGFRIGLSWIPPVSDGGAPVLDYRVFSDLGLGNGVYEIVDSNILQLNYIVEALKPGVIYSFKVAARNIYGYGIQSSPV